MNTCKKPRACICGCDGVDVRHDSLGEDELCVCAWCPDCGLSGPAIITPNNPATYGSRTARAVELWNKYMERLEGQ